MNAQASSADTLVLVHCAPGEGALWRPVVRALASEARVLTPTLRWFGAEPWPDDGRSFGAEAHARQLIAFLERETGRPAFVAAHFCGGLVPFGPCRARGPARKA